MSWSDYELCETHSVICPYCQNEDDYSCDPLGDEQTTETECGSCGKPIVVKMSATYNHHCYKKEDWNEE